MATSKPYSTWEVTFAAPERSVSFTFSRRTPGEAVAVLWAELESMPSEAEFLQNVTRIRVQKVQI